MNRPPLDKNEPTVGPTSAGPTLAGARRRGRLATVVRALQVRLRFVIVLLVAFLVVGQWGTLRTYWKAAWHRLTGASATMQGVSDDTEFFCPMDPGVISDWPAICPVCNMDLVRRKKGEATLLPEGVVARMQFSPYRIQLAGIKTSTIARRNLARELILAGRLSDGSAAARPVLDCEAYDADLPLLMEGRTASIEIEGLPGQPEITGTIIGSAATATTAAHRGPVVRFELPPNVAGVRAGQYAVARVRIPLLEMDPFRSLARQSKEPSAEGWPALPESAVVHSGGRQIVYVESMPGMFDGIEVVLGPRCGEFYPVMSGVDLGQKVATVGVFLIDAEARLNPSLAAGYFGATRASSQSSAEGGVPLTAVEAERPLPRTAARKTAGIKLSTADRALVDLQKICPVTELPLDSMGGPIAVEVAGRKVFICCKGCEGRLKKEPEKFLARIPAVK